MDPMSPLGTFGHYRPATATAHLSALCVQVDRLELIAHWRRCGLTADFVGQFIAQSLDQPTTAALVCSTVVNELMENAVKYSSVGNQLLTLRAPFLGDHLVFETTHFATLEQAEHLKAWFQRLESHDARVLFIDQIEHTAALEPGFSGLGLITLVRDYGALLGLCISRAEGNQVEVRVQALFDPDSIVNAVSIQ